MSADISLDRVFETLAVQPRKGPGSGRVVMFVAARRGEGTSTIVRNALTFAGSGAVYGVDLDLKRNALAAEVAKEATLGPAIDGRLNGASFYSITDASGRPIAESKPAFSYHRVDRSKVFVGAFDDTVVPGGRVLLTPGEEYWNAARAGGATVIVDAPAILRSPVAVRMAEYMDAVVLVVGSDPGAAPVAIAAKHQLMAAGANVIGLVHTGVPAPILKMEKLLRMAS
ncbi:hypothetical protein [Terricaulis sp.]|uniref:hypothetical protein n=1 Tax=Terricaulis sp. TaxID=2768686 RepID=UPI0037842E4E